MNTQDYKLIPLDEIAADPALKASYIEMMRRLHREFWKETKKESFIYHNMMWHFADFDDIQYGFKTYLDYVHCRGAYQEADSDTATTIFALVKGKTVVGEAGFDLFPDNGMTVCEGYDVINPPLRGQGLGNLILGLRLHKARELGAQTMILTVKSNNWQSNRRVEKLAQAGFIEESRLDDCGMVEHKICLLPRRTEQAYIDAMLVKRPAHQIPEPEPFTP